MTRLPGRVANSSPYAWPWDGLLDTSRLALVIAGDQPEWFAATHKPYEVAVVICSVASSFRAQGGAVLTVIHSMPHQRRDPGVEQASGSPRINSALIDCPVDRRIDAAGIDGFYGSRLDAELRSLGRDQLVFSGFGLETTVHSTLRSANDRGYECLTLTDACAPVDTSCGARALHSITMSGGIFGAISSSAALLDALDAPQISITPLSPANSGPTTEDLP